MATFKVKKNKETIVVEVSLPALPERGCDAAPLKETIRLNHVMEYLKSEGVEVGGIQNEPPNVSNYAGGPSSGEFVFSHVSKPREPLKTGAQVEKVIKDLTPAAQPAIMEEQPKKRKRVKRDSKTGNKTTS